MVGLRGLQCHYPGLWSDRNRQDLHYGGLQILGRGPPTRYRAPLDGGNLSLYPDAIFIKHYIYGPCELPTDI
jgi:hypothetical protein